MSSNTLGPNFDRDYTITFFAMIIGVFLIVLGMSSMTMGAPVAPAIRALLAVVVGTGVLSCALLVGHDVGRFVFALGLMLTAICSLIVSLLLGVDLLIAYLHRQPNWTYDQIVQGSLWWTGLQPLLTCGFAAAAWVSCRKWIRAQVAPLNPLGK